MSQPETRMQYADYGRHAEAIAGGLVTAGGAAAKALPKKLAELVNLRASLVNGCHFCVAMHRDALRRAGEPAARLDAVATWRESGAFDARESAAFALTDAVTKLGPDEEAFRDASAHFSPAELAALVSAIAIINAWNRVAITLGFPEADATPRPRS